MAHKKNTLEHRIEALQGKIGFRETCGDKYLKEVTQDILQGIGKILEELANKPKPQEMPANAEPPSGSGTGAKKAKVAA